MGNQQMLPLLLAAVIVGIALVRGLATLQETNKQDREAQIQQALLGTAERAQVWYRKPATLGGGGRAFSQISWRKLNLNANTPIGKFTMSEKMVDSFRLTGQSVDDPSILVSYVVYADSVILQKPR
ncbi:MAG: hypothetical protein AAB354_03710 [candidate division KSB1 bacterium]